MLYVAMRLRLVADAWESWQLHAMAEELEKAWHPLILGVGAGGREPCGDAESAARSGGQDPSAGGKGEGSGVQLGVQLGVSCFRISLEGWELADQLETAAASLSSMSQLLGLSFFPFI